MDRDQDEKNGGGQPLLAASCSSATHHLSGQPQHQDQRRPAPNAVDDAAPASWASIPKKRQLALITLARLCEAAATNSLQSYILFQLRSFKLADGSVPSQATLAFQLSLLSAVVAGPQLFTSILWGRLADSRHVGRKGVILVSLVGTGVGSLGMAFAGSFSAVVFWRLAVGLINGNLVVMRTMVKEIVGDEFESRTVLLLPTAFNVGSIIGPLLGGFLADPATSKAEPFSGRDKAAQWLLRWPFALPNVFNGVCLVACAALLAFGLEETLEGVRVRPARILSKWAETLFRKRSQPCYRKLAEEGEPDGPAGSASSHGSREKRGPLMRVWTPRLAMTLLARALLMMHVGAYPSLLLAFISTPRYDASSAGDKTTAPANDSLVVPPDYHPSAPFTFTGGLSFKPSGIAMALTIRGIGGLVLQLLFFPRLKSALGTIRLYRYSLLLFPLSYLVTPYLATISSSTSPPLPAAGALLWTAIALVLTIQTMARSFALPSGTMLLNAASPDRAALGTVNGIGQSVSAAARTAGPLLAGWLYGVGLGHGVVGVAWWAFAAVAVSAAVAGGWVTTEDGVKSGQGKKRRAQGDTRHDAEQRLC